MGKQQDLNSLAISVGNTAAHKIILQKTNKPDSKNHLSAEIRDYSFDAFSKSQKHKWNKEDIERLRNKAEYIAKRFLKRYPDIKYQERETKESVTDTMQELLLI